MFAQALSDRLARVGVHYAWVIVAVTFVTSLCTAGAVGVPGALILPLIKEFGWDLSQVSAALAVRIVLYGLLAPFAAAFIERYGVRRVAISAIALIVVGLLSALGMTHAWQLMMFWGIMVGVGTGLTALVLGAIVSNRWFSARKGLVLGLLTASAATGQLIFLPLAAWLVEHYGWRTALVPSIAGLGLAAALLALFMRDRPSDLGLAPFGATKIDPAPAETGSALAAVARTFSILREGAANPTFWALFATFFICGLSTNGLVQTHFIAFCADFGMPQIEAASTLALMGVFDFFGTILSGYLSDRYNNRWLLFWYYGLRGLSLIWLPHSTFTLYGLSIFALFYGLDWIATVPPTVRLAAQTFGPQKAGVIFGWVFAGHQLGAATAAYGAGLSRSMLLTYLPAFYGAGAACLLAALIIVMVGRPSPRPALAPA